MSETRAIATAKAYTYFRDYYKENKYLGGFIKTSHLVKTNRLEDEVIVRVPKGTKVTIKEYS